MTTTVSGPMFEPSRHGSHRSVLDKEGGHYNIYHLDDDGRGYVDPEAGMAALRQLFPDGEASEFHFALFSTSGVHGTYRTIEEIEASLRKYGDDGPHVPDGEAPPDDWHNELTVLVVEHRAVCLRCGNVRVRLADVAWLKHLRSSSRIAVQGIGQ